MAIATFDTLKFANTLKAAGVPDKQAEAEANAFAEIIQVQVKDLATKADLDRQSEDLKREIADVKKELKQEIADVKKELKQEIEVLRNEIIGVKTELKSDLAVFRSDTKGEFLLLKWMFGAMMTGVTAIVIRLFFMRGTM
jgi:phage host-nuclease inhibitor protein Gam